MPEGDRLLLVLLSLLGTTAPVPSSILEVIHSGDDGTAVRITVPEPVFIDTPHGIYPALPGASLLALEDDFLRPAYSFCVPVPPGEDPGIEFTVTATRRVEPPPGSWARTPVLIGTGLELRETVPTSPLPSGVDPVDVRVMQMAGTRIAVVTVLPFHGTTLSEYSSEVTVSLSWPARAGSVSPEGSLAGLISLPGLQMWLPDRVDQADSPFWGRPWARISILQTGFYRLTGEDLTAAGLDVVGTPTASLSLWSGPGLQFDIESPDEEHQLAAVALRVNDGGDGLFDSGDSLMFFALSLNRFEPDTSGQLQRLQHRYATHNVYWLSWGGEDGARMTSQSVQPDASPSWGDSLEDNLWLEQEISWLPKYEKTTGWAWSTLWKNVPGYFYFSSPSPDGPGRLTISLIADGAGAHKIQVYMGSELIADTTWNGIGAKDLTFDGIEMDASLNQLKLVVIDGPGVTYLDQIHAVWPRRLSYGVGRVLFFTGSAAGRYGFSIGGAIASGSPEGECMLFDASDPFQPVELIGFDQTEDVISFSHDVNGTTRLIAVNPDNWLTPDSITTASPGRIQGTIPQGNVAIVAGDELMSAAEPLLDLYGRRGIASVLVSTREVYDEFGQGVRDPGAIRSFFRYTQDSWNDPAEALLLVGDGNYDPLMHITADRTQVPVYVNLVDDGGQLSEDFFVVAHFGGILPEIPVSRITVSTAFELTLYLEKIAGYDQGFARGEWCNQVLLIADDEWGGYSGDEPYHTLTCELLADSLFPKDVNREKFYLIEYPWPPGTTSESLHPEKPLARQDLIARLSEGCSAFVFFGHGSYGQIAHEKLLMTSDINMLQNGAMLPLACFATCNIGQFDLISTDCMGEEFILKSDGGSIATIAATRGTYSGQNENLYLSIFDFIFNNEGYTIGEALWAGKIANPGGTHNHLNVLIGDGGVELLRPDESGADIDIAGGVLNRGRINTLSTYVPEPVTGWASVTESGAYTTYICLLGSTELTWLRYGDMAYTGMVSSGEPGTIDVDFFMPVQADTGFYGRCSMTFLSEGSLRTACREWTDVVDSGGYPGDSTGPAIALRVNGFGQQEEPVVSNPVNLAATLTDPSGICVFGGSAGRAILMSLDSQGFDLSSCFRFRAGSYTTGDLEFELPELLEGSHRIILAAWDGMGNGSQDTLDFTVVGEPQDLVSGIFVFPNPGSGPRAFSFQAATAGTFCISVYTVGGRKIWSTTGTCDQGYNQVLWDSRDMEGDLPGSGAYIYRLEFDSEQLGSDSFTDVLAILRE
jgi:hypothetical protein